MSTYLDNYQSAILTQPIFLCNGRCSLVIGEIRFISSPITLTQEAFYFINFVLNWMINNTIKAIL